jgi:hypothetical protein
MRDATPVHLPFVLHFYDATQDSGLSGYEGDSETEIEILISLTPLMKKLRAMRASRDWYTGHRQRMKQQPVRCKPYRSNSSSGGGSDDEGSNFRVLAGKRGSKMYRNRRQGFTGRRGEFAQVRELYE